MHMKVKYFVSYHLDSRILTDFSVVNCVCTLSLEQAQWQKQIFEKYKNLVGRK
jgi:hypothetical protein